MVNLVRIGIGTGEDDPQLNAARAQLAVALQQQAKAGPTVLPLAEGRFGKQATYNSGNALADILNGLVNAYAVNKATAKASGLQDQQDAALAQANQQKVNALAPAMNRGAPISEPSTLDSVGQNDPAVTLSAQQKTPDTVNPVHNDLISAVAGMPPQAAGSFLSQALASRALAPPPPNYDLAPGAVRYSGTTNQPLASAPAKAPAEPQLQATEEGIVFHKTGPLAGQFTDSSGKVLSSAEVAARHAANAGAQAAAAGAAQNKAKLAAFTPDSMDYWVEWSKQHGGSAPPGSRSPQFLLAFGNAMKADALSRGDTIAATVADSRVKQALQPAMAQTEKQIGANSSFLKTIEKNIGNADALAQSVGGNNSPSMNAIFNAWKRHVPGDPNVRQLDFWNNAIQGEAAKIASGGVGSVSATSDAQIAKQVKLMQTADNYATWRAAADAIIQEGHNRLSGLNETMDEFKNQSAGAAASPPATPSAAPPTDLAAQAAAEQARRKAARGG